MNTPWYSYRVILSTPIDGKNEIEVEGSSIDSVVGYLQAEGIAYDNVIPPYDLC